MKRAYSNHETDSEFVRDLELQFEAGCANSNTCNISAMFLSYSILASWHLQMPQVSEETGLKVKELSIRPQLHLWQQILL